MDVECCRSCTGFDHGSYQPRLFRKNTYQFNRVCRFSRQIVTPLLFLLLLGLVNAAAQGRNDAGSQLINGFIVTAQGQPVTGAMVEVRNLRGVEMGRSVTNSAGAFSISTAANPGDYILLAAKGSQIRDERIVLGESDLGVSIVLPAASENAVPTRPGYTVSTTALSVPEKAWLHLQSAHREFGKANLSEASVEIDRAMQVAPEFAQAFSMRALLKLASRDFEGAAEDARRAVSLDPLDAGAYIGLGTAYNSLNEFEKAEEAERQALSLNPESWQARLEMAKSLYGQNEFVLALRELDLLNKDFPDVHLVRGNVLIRLGRGAEGAGEFAVFQAEAPNDPRCEQVRRIVANMRQRQTDANLSVK